MKMLARAAFALSAFFACAIAAPALALPGAAASCPRADGAYIACYPMIWSDPITGLPLALQNGGLPVSDPSGASYLFAPAGGVAEGSSAAAFTFSAATLAKAKAFYAVCPSGGGSFLPIDTNGGSPGIAISLPTGYSVLGLSLKGWTGNTGCYFGAHF